jgi:hypothetical protein
MNQYMYTSDHEVTATFSQRSVLRTERKGVQRRLTRKAVRA